VRCLVLVVSCLLLAGIASAQSVEVEYFACDTAKTIDLNSPTMHREMEDLGIVADEGADPMAIVTQLIGQLVDKPFEFAAFAVRITNKSDQTIPLKPSAVQLQEGTWVDTQADFKGATSKPASGYTSWTGGLSLFAKAKELAPGASATGVVLFEQEPAAAPVAVQSSMDTGMGGMGGEMGGMGAAAAAPVAPKNPQRVQYVPPKDVKVKVAEAQPQARLLDALDLEWTIDASPTPAPGETVIYPAMGNTGTKDDETPTRVGVPGAIRPAPAKAIAASANIIGQPPTPVATGGGTEMPGMGGAGMLPSAPGSAMPGEPGGMPGMPGVGGAMPAMPGATDTGGLPAMPGTLPADTGKRPRRPGAAGEE
jgi:hypothetical protein